jgi:hypothetical protein
MLPLASDLGMATDLRRLEHPAIRHRRDRLDRELGDQRYWPKEPIVFEASRYCQPPSVNLHGVDLEDREIIDWGLAQCEAATGPRAKVDVLYGEGNDLRKASGILSHENLHK